MKGRNSMQGAGRMNLRILAGLGSLAVSVAQAQTWSAPLPLVPLNNTDAIGSHWVAENALGQIAAVWQQGTGVRARVRSGTRWGSVAVLGDPQATNAVVDLAMAANGEAVTLLRSTATGATGVIQSSFFTNGTWTMAAPIPVSAGLSATAARVRYDGAGQATLVWTETDGSQCTIRGSSGTAAAGWSAPATIGTGCYDLMQLAVNNRGDAVLALGATVIPRPGSRAGSPALAAFRSHGGSWSTLFDVGSTGVGNGPYQTAPTVAIAPNGSAILLLSDANVGVKWSRKSAASNSWSATTWIDGAEPAVPTAVAVDSKGNAVAVFPSYYSNVGPAPLLATRLPAGSFQWSPAKTVTDPSSDIASFQLTTTPAGSFVAGWLDDYAVGGPVNSTATLGVSVLASATGTWSSTLLDADYSFVSPPDDTVAVAAATGKAVALWNLQTRASGGGSGNPLLKVATAKLP